MNFINRYIVILAGGKGDRLWPLSRKKKPKQLLSFGSKKSLLEQTIDRVQALVPRQNLWIITTQEQHQQIFDLVGNKVGKIIAEPLSRNTAPAILLSCMIIAEENPDASIMIIPADHYITDNKVFGDYLQHMFTASEDSKKIILLGLKPTYPATGYGYIEYSKQLSSSLPLYDIENFHEKPSNKTAELYLCLPSMLWNIGIFCAEVAVFLHEYKTLAPKLYENVTKTRVDESYYALCENISIDYAIMEKTTKSSVIAAEFLWSDVGNLETFLSLQVTEKTSNMCITIDSTNNIISVEDKLVALIGVENLCIVQTGDVLLISQRSDVEKVKLVVQQLQTHNNQYL